VTAATSTSVGDNLIPAEAACRACHEIDRAQPAKAVAPGTPAARCDACHLVESGGALEIFEDARHPYTRALLSAVPRLDVDAAAPLEFIVGSPPDMIEPPRGCPFAPRCRYSMKVCHEEMPPLTRHSDTHGARCFLSEPGASPARERFERDYAAETEVRQ
jgi:oligopeptide/dipeptide ABC transporter ATP-binding protein